MSVVGVLALQGGFAVHGAALRELGHEIVFVGLPDDLDRVAGLVLPGGESTAQWKLLESAGLVDPIRAFARAGRPILATCAGLILIAERVIASSPSTAVNAIEHYLGLLAVDVVRNAYGRQLDSFEGQDDAQRHDLVFIRAPRITRVGPEVNVLATLSGEPILVRQGAIVGAAFHPELTADRRLHELAFGSRTGSSSRRLYGFPGQVTAPRGITAPDASPSAAATSAGSGAPPLFATLPARTR